MLCVAHKNFIPEFAFFEINFSNSVVALGSKLDVGSSIITILGYVASALTKAIR